ncbi:MAG: enoyl-CoA hydratase/isomerase family protein, partial [bacterium]|nr:enoyl-CoA hydratase/isomerase family protein [bacterium]
GLLRQLTEKIDDAGKDTDVRVIILESEGEKTFCSGASFDELLKIDDLDSGKEFFMGFARVINSMRRCPKIIIGRIHGKVVGGGIGIVSTVDYALAHDSASVRLSELSLGIGPFVIGPAVERKVGPGAFTEMTIDTEWKTAEWAKINGLYVELYSDIKELDNAVDSLADRLAGFSPDAIAELKKMFWTGTDNWNTLLHKRAEISGRLVLSEFTGNAIEKFKNKK